MKIIILFWSTFLSLSSFAQMSGNCLNFDGVDDYIDCPLPSVFNSIGTSEFTIELWANPTVGTFERLFFAQMNISDFAAISLSGSGEVIFYLEENGINHSVESINTLNPLEWVHIAVTWNSVSQESKIFINGDEVQYSSGLFVSSTGTDDKMTIGSRTDGAQPFNGSIDEFAIWNVAKSECEISFEMNEKVIGFEPNLIVSYIFDAGLVVPGPNPSVTYLTALPTALPTASLDGDLMNFTLNGTTSNWIPSGANIHRLWGVVTQVAVGQLGLVSLIYADQYQWIYCDDLSPVPGATNITFDPPTEDPNYTGVIDSYAVVSTKGNCVDTSECYFVNSNVSVDELDLESLVSIYPNPSQGSVWIKSSLDIELIEIKNLAGQLIEVITPSSIGNVQVELTKESGVYIVILHTNAGLITKKVLVQNK